MQSIFVFLFVLFQKLRELNFFFHFSANHKDENNKEKKYRQNRNQQIDQEHSFTVKFIALNI
jgi:hypothetical protein